MRRIVVRSVVVVSLLAFSAAAFAAPRAQPPRNRGIKAIIRALGDLLITPTPRPASTPKQP